MSRVSLIAAFRGGLLLVGKRNDTGKYTLAGGHLEDDEDPEQGARRELLEETGLEPEGELKLIDERKLGETTLYTYRCEVTGNPTGENDPDRECDLWTFVDVSDGIPKAIAENMAGPKDPEKNVTADVFGIAKAEVLSEALRDVDPGLRQLARFRLGTPTDEDLLDGGGSNLVDVLAEGDGPEREIKMTPEMILAEWSRR